MKKTLLRGSCLLLMLVLLLPSFSGCAFGFRASLQREFDMLLEQTMLGMFQGSEFNYKNAFRDPERYGLSYETHQILDRSVLNAYTKSERDARKKELKAAIAQLERINPIVLKKTQKPSYYALLDYMKIELKYIDVTDYSSLIAPSSGFIANMGISFYEYPFDTKSDIEHYLAFLENIPDALDTVITYTEQKMDDMGYKVSKYIVNENVNYLKNYGDKESSPFVDGFADKIEAVTFLSDSVKQSFIVKNEDILSDIVFPAFDDCCAAMKSWKTASSKSLAEYEGGKEYYKYLLETGSGTDMSPEEMIIYLEEKYDYYYDIIQNSSAAILNQYMQSDYGINIQTPEKVIEMLSEATQNRLPEIEDPGCCLTDLPASLSISGMLAYYVIPQVDSESSNVVRLNRGQLGQGKNLALYLDTIAHESYPGHLYQINYWRQNGIHPLNNWMSFKAVSEGWADYIAHKSLNWVGISRALNSVITADYMLTQIVTALADIQVNYMGMNANKMNAYICQKMNMNPSEKPFVYMYDVLTADPGIYVPYAMGFLQVTDLETQVGVELHGKYEDIDFYRAYLNAGSCSFASMKKLIYDELGIE